MAFDPKEIKGKLRLIKGKRRAYFLFCDRDSDDQPLLMLDRKPIRGSTISAKKRAAKGRLYVGKIWRSTENEKFVFHGKKPIPAGRFNKAIKLIAKQCRPLAGATLFAGPDDGVTEAPEEQKGTSAPKMLPPILAGDERGARLFETATLSAQQSQEAAQQVNAYAKAADEAAEQVLKLEDEIDQLLQGDALFRTQQAAAERAMATLEDTTDQLLAKMDTVDEHKLRIQQLEQNQDLSSFVGKIAAATAALKAAKTDEERAAAQATLDARQVEFQKRKDARDAELDALREELLTAEAQITHLEKMVSFQTDNLNAVEATRNDRRDHLLLSRDDLKTTLAEHNARLEQNTEQEQLASQQLQKLDAKATEDARQLQARADTLAAKAYLEKGSDRSKGTELRAITQRQRARKSLSNTKLLKTLQEGDTALLEERLAQMGTSPEEYLISIGLLTGTDKTDTTTREPVSSAPVSLSASKEKLGKYIDGLSEDEKTALTALSRHNSDWKKVKETVGGGGKEGEAASKSMHALRMLRQQFMDDALKQTTVQFTANIRAQMDAWVESADLPPKEKERLRAAITNIELVEHKDDPSKESNVEQYKDGRKRRYQMVITDDTLKAAFGETLTVNFFAPGSTRDTSDIDMQFICEENPTACTNLIETFRTVSEERRVGLNEVLSEKLGDGAPQLASMAEGFDTNPYPAGFVKRPELGTGLHFSDTFTERSIEDKRLADVGLSLLRNLEHPPKGTSSDALIDQLLGESERTGDPAGKIRARRALTVGVSVSMYAQVSQAESLMEECIQSPLYNDETGNDAFKADVTALRELLQQAKVVSDKMPPPQDSSGASESAGVLKEAQALANALAAQINTLSKHDGGSRLLSNARQKAFTKAQGEVESYTRARDLALVEGTEKAAESRVRLNIVDRYERALEMQARMSGASLDTLKPHIAAMDTVIVGMKSLYDAAQDLSKPLPDDAREKLSQLSRALKAIRAPAQDAGIDMTKPKRSSMAQKIAARHDADIEAMRAATSALGTAGFVLQGLALHCADEAYTSRGAIGLVVEEGQMKEKVVTTTGTAVSSLESNAGFFHEHVEHELEHIDDINAPVETPRARKQLTEFAVGVCKYVERIRIAAEKADPDQVGEALVEYGLAWLEPFSVGLLAIKDGIDPLSGKEPADLATCATTFLAGYGVRSVGDFQKKILGIEEQLRLAMWAQSSAGMHKDPKLSVQEEITKAVTAQKRSKRTLER